jgi:magnesium-protoporphyrin O-methyltransferase
MSAERRGRVRVANEGARMTCSQCLGIEKQFDDRVAGRQLRRYRKKGPAKTTRMLLDALRASGVHDATFLDVGGGVGAIQHELMREGAASGVNVDASPAYLATAREEAVARGFADRMRYLEGDIVDARIDPGEADFVTLDRVVCCYHDMPALVDATASRARRGYGLVYPRDNVFGRVAIQLVNLVQRVRRHPFRAFVHPTDAVEARVASHGLRKSYHAHSTVWQVALFTREATSVTADS